MFGRASQLAIDGQPREVVLSLQRKGGYFEIFERLARGFLPRPGVFDLASP